MTGTAILSFIVERDSFDAGYVERLASGDTETERHFTEYFGELLSIKLRSRLRAPHLIEDAKQETFLRVLVAVRKKGGIANPRALGAFVNSVANNVLFEVYRSEAKVAEAPEDRVGNYVDAEATLVDNEAKARVREVLSHLPKKDQTILKWLFFDEKDKGQVCSQLKVDREYLRVLLHRAKEKFRSGYLKPHQLPDRGTETNRPRTTPKR